MTPQARLTPLPADVLKRVRIAWVDGLSIEVIRERFRLSREKLMAAVADLPKRERPKAQTKRVTRIPKDLE